MHSIQADLRNTNSVVKALDDAKNKDSQITLILTANNRSDLYSEIKYSTCHTFPLRTQVVTAKVAAKTAPSIPTKIAIQMSCKLGGAPWLTSLPPATMFIGYDVCHDTKNKKNSFAALVATINMEKGRYFSVVTKHESGVELSANVSLNVLGAVKAYYRANNVLPKNIVFYRDGVGEGQLRHVYETEVKNVRDKLTTMYEQQGLPLSFAFIVVTKRINTRIFSMANDNPEPGTVVDDVITMHERYDFYLVSQKANQGTVSPTAYNVLRDSTKFTPCQIQEMTYRLCHMYYNYSGTIRVPSVCQYAHKLAFLCGQFVHAVPHPGLAHQLFFL